MPQNQRGLLLTAAGVVSLLFDMAMLFAVKVSAHLPAPVNLLIYPIVAIPSVVVILVGVVMMARNPKA